MASSPSAVLATGARARIRPFHPDRPAGRRSCSRTAENRIYLSAARNALLRAPGSRRARQRTSHCPARFRPGCGGHR